MRGWKNILNKRKATVMLDLDRWEADLESGEYTPADGYLNLGDNWMCCLGVLLDQTARWEVGNAADILYYTTEGNSSVPPLNVQRFLDQHLDLEAMRKVAEFGGYPTVTSVLMCVNDQAVHAGATDYSAVLELIRVGRAARAEKGK